MRPGDDAGAEDLSDVDLAEPQVVGDGGRVEDERGEGERDQYERRGGDDSQKASPGAGPQSMGRSGSGACSRSTGAPYGKWLVTSREKAYVWAE